MPPSKTAGSVRLAVERPKPPISPNARRQQHHPELLARSPVAAQALNNRPHCCVRSRHRVCAYQDGLSWRTAPARKQQPWLQGVAGSKFSWALLNLGHRSPQLRHNTFAGEECTVVGEGNGCRPSVGAKGCQGWHRPLVRKARS